MMKTTGIMIALLAIASSAKAAPQVCQGEDRRLGETYRLLVDEMGLPKGTLVRTVAFKDGRRVRGLYQVERHLNSGFGMYAFLKFVSGDASRSYKFLIAHGKTFLVTDDGSAQLFCK